MIIERGSKRSSAFGPVLALGGPAACECRYRMTNDCMCGGVTISTHAQMMTASLASSIIFTQTHIPFVTSVCAGLLVYLVLPP